MTQKPPPRRSNPTDKSKRSSSTRSKPASSSRSSSSRSSSSFKMPDMPKLKVPGRGRSSTAGFIVTALIVLCVACGVGALLLNEGLGDEETATRAPITPGSTRTTGDVLPTRTDDAAAADWYAVYFTDAECPDEEERGEGLDSIIAETISQAEESVDIAVFELDSEPIVEALIGLEEQGIPVRVVIDTDYEDESSINRLRRNGISVVTDDRSAFMHNKFTVIDQRYVWIGSMNYMPNDIYCNNNNLVWFDSEELAANYTTEMDEMYEERSFGPRSTVNTPAEQLNIGGVAVENYFAPEIEVAPIVGDLIRQAQNEILFMTFSFTHEDVGEAMLEMAEEGVTVQGVFETTGSDQSFSYYTIMNEENVPGVEIRRDGNPRIMHHKVIILDRQTVIFGSFNFTGSANDSNDENLVVVHDPTFASFFVEEFFWVWEQGR